MSSSTDHNEVQAYQKITLGFAVQNYMLNKHGRYICIEQYFEGSDDVNRVNEEGDAVDIDIQLEDYQCLDMDQPQDKLDFDDWFEENKHNDSVQRYFRGVIEENPDTTLTFREWAKRYYDECVNVK